MKKHCFISIMCVLLAFETVQGRENEKLDRSAVAVARPEGGNYLSWRLLVSDSQAIAFNIYRDNVLVNPEPITDSTNYIDTAGTTQSVYRIDVINSPNSPVDENVSVWAKQYSEISLEAPVDDKYPGEPVTYRPNDVSVGDLDGDGEYELVLKWDGVSKDNSQSGYTSCTWLEGLELSGKSLWKINLGINIRSGAHYSPFVVFDLDQDGKAELVCKTADGTADGLGKRLGTDKDYRNKDGYILAGPEYLTVFDGLTGRAIDTVDYIPPRGEVKFWGDKYGNRVDRFLAGAGWLSAERPSVIMARGYYSGKNGPGRTAIVAWDYKDGKLVVRWVFDTIDGEHNDYIGQGNHSMYIADIDADGYDEITYGSCAIDHDGKALYNTRLGHGDAGHLGDLDPSRAGLEFFMPHESAMPGKIPGVDFRDARSGDLLWSLPVDKQSDVGRGVAGDIYAGSEGAECWSALNKNLYSCKGEIIGESPSSCNFLIWWDGDATRELLDSNWIGKYQPGQRGNIYRIFTAEGCSSINGTKANPSLSGDILGDWREELVLPTQDGKALRVYTTIIPTETRRVTLMQDAVYRLGIAGQNSGYNQPPHLGEPLLKK